MNKRIVAWMLVMALLQVPSVWADPMVGEVQGPVESAVTDGAPNSADAQVAQARLVEQALANFMNRGVPPPVLARPDPIPDPTVAAVAAVPPPAASLAAAVVVAAVPPPGNNPPDLNLTDQQFADLLAQVLSQVHFGLPPAFTWTQFIWMPLPIVLPPPFPYPISIPAPLDPSTIIWIPLPLALPFVIFIPTPFSMPQIPPPSPPPGPALPPRPMPAPPP